MSKHITDMKDDDSIFTATEPQGLPTMTTAPMSRNSLTLRPNGNPLQASSSRSRQQSDQQIAAGMSANANNNITTNDPSSNAVAFQRMMIESQAISIKRDLLDTGSQTADDIEYFYQHLQYPARAITNVQIVIGYSIRGRGHPQNAMQAIISRCHQASTCNTFKNLMNATKADWEDAFLDVGLSPLTEGMQRKDVIVWSKRTYGGNTWDWIEAQRTGDYEKWFQDYVVHGRSLVLNLLLRYKGPI